MMGGVVTRWARTEADVARSKGEPNQGKSIQIANLLPY
jgi:hypothetical protein